MSKEAMKLALEALESCGAGHISDGGNQWHDEKLVDKAITALREALAEQPAQHEPVKHELLCICGCSWEIDADGNEELVSSPPAQQEPEIVQRVKRFAGKTLRTARNPNITARECIELANWLAAHNIKENT